MLSDADGERDEVAEVSPSEASPTDKEAKSRAIAPKLTRSETAVTFEPAKTETTQAKPEKAKPEKKAGHSAHAPSQQMAQHGPQVMTQPLVYQHALQPALQPMMVVNHPHQPAHHRDDHHYHH